MDSATAERVRQGRKFAAAAADYHRGRPDYPAAEGWCDHCGRARDEPGHERCAAARAMEPPRFCPRCRRRMKVQVLPSGWTAACAVHGTIDAGAPAPERRNG